MATASLNLNPPGGLYWLASLLFMFLSSIASVLITVFVMNKKRSRPLSAAGGVCCNVDPSCSSSISGQPGEQFDVFLSFRGSDTRKGFGDFLYTALVDAGLRVFRDNEELPVGNEIGPELLQGIKNSAISIPIFSVNYASSKWCLEEFAFMMECREARKQLVLPVFYDVTPNEVQHQTGSYDRAFRRHAKKEDPVTIQKWTRALQKVGFLKGWEVKNEANGYEGKVANMIVTKVLRELKNGQLSAGNFLVGIDYRVKAVMRMLAVEEPDVKLIGIWGMGGIGKTTLSKVIFNKMIGDFDSHSFLQDIRETSTRSPNGLQKLQSQLVSDLLRCHHTEFNTTDEGVSVLQRRFREMKVLLLLDDVDHIDQLKALTAELHWFGRGSRIIVTTRDKDILRLTQGHSVYEVGELGQHDALKLFSWHALRKDAPTEKLRSLCEEIVEGMGGLPLALEVIGSFLHGKKEDVWKATMQKLKRVPEKKVFDTLKISYDALEHEQQQMFLDIACFLVWEDNRNVAYMWEDLYKFSPESNIEVLQLLSLIKVENGKSFWMHDQLRDLGREIVRRENYENPGKRSRVWGNEAFEVLQNDLGSKSIQAIRLEYKTGLEDCCFSSRHFRKLSKLRFLQLDCANIEGSFENLLPALIWLRWRIPSLNCTATNLNPKALLILELFDSKVTHNWNGWNSIQMTAKKLKVLELINCNELTRTPKLSSFVNLERITLNGCRKLQTIDPSVGKLEHLISLHLKACCRLRELPKHMNSKALVELVVDETLVQELPTLEGCSKIETLTAQRCDQLTRLPRFICHLTSLRDLNLNRSKITELPESIGLLVTLHRLTLEGTHLKQLPKSIGGLKSLVELDISKTKVSILPDSIENLVSLEVLKIDRSSIQCIPGAVGQLEKLRRLDASRCRFLGEIPVELGRLSLLQYLGLSHTNIRCIPAEMMRGLSSLETLYLGWCKQLTSVPDLPCTLRNVSLTCHQSVPIPNLYDLANLRQLEMVHISRSNVGIFEGLGLNILRVIRCQLLERLTGFSHLQSLTNLRIHGCPKLMEIEGLGELLSLEKLFISLCAGISKLDILGKLESLMDLEIRNCENLESLTVSSKSSVLKNIKIKWCEKLVEVQGIGDLHALEALICEGCIKLKGLDGLDKLGAMRQLRISRCQSIEKLPSLANLHDLQWLEVDSCENLQRLEGLESLERIYELKIFECKAIERLPDLSNLKSLEDLHVYDCDNLQELKGLDKTVELSILSIAGCQSIERLPDLSNLKSLQELRVDGCDNLQELKGLDKTVELRRLSIKGCRSIERLSDLSNLKSLRELNVDGCDNLQGLKGLDKTVKLKRLSIKGCKSIERLPDLSNLKLLESFNNDGCEKLSQVKGLKLKELSDDETMSYPDVDIKEFLYGNDINKLQQLNEPNVLDMYADEERHELPDELLGESNFGLLRQWYANGCENVPQLEGLVNLQDYHLHVLPDSHQFIFYHIY